MENITINDTINRRTPILNYITLEFKYGNKKDYYKSKKLFISLKMMFMA